MARSDRTCSVEGCARSHLALGFCGPHWYRLHKFGDPLAGRPISLHGDNLERLMVHVAKDVAPGCWLWTASLGPFGYGQVRWTGTMRRAHRVIYELLVGPVPKGLELDHLCRVRRCVNPDHLEPVTHQVNSLRGAAPSAIAVRENRCLQGHPFTAENTYVRPNGKRLCNECRRAYARARYHRLKSTRNPPNLPDEIG